MVNPGNLVIVKYYMETLEERVPSLYVDILLDKEKKTERCSGKEDEISTKRRK